MINLRDNIWIEGFNNHNNLIAYYDSLVHERKERIYCGKSSEIREEIAKECVKKWCSGNGFYNNYKTESQYTEYLCKTAKQSILSACDKEFCIIFMK